MIVRYCVWIRLLGRLLPLTTGLLTVAFWIAKYFSLVDEASLQNINTAGAVSVDLLRLIAKTTDKTLIHERVPQMLAFTMQVFQLINQTNTTYQKLHPNQKNGSVMVKRDLKGEATQLALNWLTNWLPYYMVDSSYRPNIYSMYEIDVSIGRAIGPFSEVSVILGGTWGNLCL